MRRLSPGLVWHGKGRTDAVNTELEEWPNQKHSHLRWNVRKASGYISGHTQCLVNYAARYRKGLPIGSGIAESAVNLVVSLRMAKKRQMRWSDEGAHALAQVRVADLHGKPVISQTGLSGFIIFKSCLGLTPYLSKRDVDRRQQGGGKDFGVFAF